MYSHTVLRFSKFTMVCTDTHRYSTRVLSLSLSPIQYSNSCLLTLYRVGLSELFKGDLFPLKFWCALQLSVASYIQTRAQLALKYEFLCLVVVIYCLQVHVCDSGMRRRVRRATDCVPQHGHCSSTNRSFNSSTRSLSVHLFDVLLTQTLTAK